MIPDFSFSLALVECGLWAKMRWQKLGSISKTKVHGYNHAEPTWVPCHPSAPDWRQNQQHVLYHYHSPAAPPAVLSQGRNPHGKRLVAHVDNCLIHRSMATGSFMKTRDMVSIPHQPYSSDMVLSDFYLSSTVKKRLNYVGITDEDQLFKGFHTILRSIPGCKL
jgi:hypothetical protein